MQCKVLEGLKFSNAQYCTLQKREAAFHVDARHDVSVRLISFRKFPKIKNRKYTYLTVKKKMKTVFVERFKTTLGETEHGEKQWIDYRFK